MLGAKLGISSKQYNIVTDGLVFDVEPGFQKSCDGTSIWNLSSGSNQVLSNYTGSFVTDASFVGTSGNDAGYFALDGTDGYLYFGDTNQLNLFSGNVPCTLEAWFRTDPDHAGEDKRYAIFSRFSNSDPWAGFALAVGANTNGTKLEIWQAGGHWVYGSDDVQTGLWVHGMVTYTGTQSSGLKFYKNGSLSSTETAYGTPSMGTSNDRFQIGCQYYSSAIQRLMDGRIGSCRIYNRALSPGEVLQNYNATKDRYTN